jgi:energy-coupling factor transporter ATP-binding protein EcfA2
VISKIGISGFKSFQKVSLELGKLNIFIGTNASGKSNFFDALRVLQGIGYGFTIGEIFNGKPKGAGSEVWEGIRGGSALAAFRPVAEDSWIGLEVELTLRRSEAAARYSANIMPRDSMISERLCLGSTLVFESIPREDEDCSVGFGYRADSETAMNEVREALRNMQRLDPSTATLRDYSQPGEVRRMGEHGENFAAVVQSIMKDSGASSAYMSWLKELTPEEGDVEILFGPKQDALFALKRQGEVFLAPVLSDGTLRFAAIAAAFFQPEMPEILMIEEIEDGIHPTRLRLLVELLKSQSQDDGPQTIVTTHSPFVLAWLKPEDYKTTFLCQRDESSGASTITPLSEIPRFMDVVKKHSIADLIANGWLETVL